MARKRSEIKAGVLILVCFVLFWVMLFSISDIGNLFLPKKHYVLAFNQVGGLEKNSAVRYAGYEVGRVIDISYTEPVSSKDGTVIKKKRLPELTPEEVLKVRPETRAENVFVVVEVGHNIIVTDLDRASINASFTGNVYLSIQPCCLKPEQKPIELTEDHVLYGQPYMTMGELITRASHILDGVKDVMPSLKRAVSGFADTMKEGKATIVRINATLDDNRPRIDQTFADVAEASKNIKGMTADARPKLPELLAKVKEAAGDAAEMLATIKPKVVASADNIQQATSNVKETTSQALLTVSQNRQRVDQILDNFRDASARLNLGMEDIRRNPWKLLTRNINADPKTQNVYDAALAFSDAARALSQATNDLKALADSGAADSKAVDAASRELNKLVENLGIIERDLYRLFKEHPAP